MKICDVSIEILNANSMADTRLRILFYGFVKYEHVNEEKNSDPMERNESSLFDTNHITVKENLLISCSNKMHSKQQNIHLDNICCSCSNE